MQNVLDRIRKQFGDVVGFDDAHPPGVKSMVIKTPSVDRTNRLVSGLVSTDDVDLDREVVRQDGFDRSYFPDQIKAVYLDHNYFTPGQVSSVGVCRNLTTRGDGLYATTWVRETPLGEDVLVAVDDGALSGFSIGFQILSASAPTPDEDAKHPGVERVIRACKLLEYSFTSMPANGAARVKSLLDGGRIRRESACLMAAEIEPKATWRGGERKRVVLLTD